MAGIRQEIRGLNMRALLLGLFVFLSLSDIGLAQDVEQVTEPLFYVEKCTTVWCTLLSGFPEINAWLLAIFTFLGLTLRGAADFLGFVGKMLHNKGTSDLATKLGSWAIWAAQAVGWFGGGTPKVTAEKIASKDAKDGTGSPEKTVIS